MDMVMVFGLSLLLRRMPVKPIVDRFVSHKGVLENYPSPDSYAKSLYDEERFVRACLHEYPQYSENEAKNMLQKLKQSVKSSEFSDCGLFSIILSIASQALRIDGNAVICRHGEMVNWREAVHGIGQSPFICALLAWEDFKTGYRRTAFDFTPYAKTDNLRLRQMLSQGIAENHYHLKGSAPAFLLSWVCLMNHIRNRKADFKSIGRTFFRTMEEDSSCSLHYLTWQAAVIRLFFSRLLSLSSEQHKKDKYKKWLRHGNETFIMTIHELQREIDTQRIRFGKSLDYTVNTETFFSAYAPIAGEHAFIYRVFLSIFRRDPKIMPHIDLFYAYLLIFVCMRSELIQINNAVGFHNFFLYQDRKEKFVDNYKRYSDALIRMAHFSALENTALKSLEVRITPKDNRFELKRSLLKTMRFAKFQNTKKCRKCDDFNQKIDRCKAEKGLCGINLKRTFYVLHLVKQPEPKIKDPLHCLTHYRHYKLRRYTVEPTVRSIIKWRAGGNATAAHVYGIDACNQEIGCRPEVFAPSFRYVREISFSKSRVHLHNVKLPILRVTYHVGEDFLDIADGLRAIDEAIIFLDMRYGDRLGHAIALGINAKDWYNFKGKRILLPKQDMLDNVVWMYTKLHRYGLCDHELSYDLRNIFKENFNYIYSNNQQLIKEDISIETYYNAWRLRGDHPKFYLEYETEKFSKQVLFADTGDLQKDNTCNPLREGNWQARYLMHLYHYHPQVRQRGAEITDHTVTPRYIQAVSQLQEVMRRDIASMGIAVETNPSSNYLISTFKRYDNHPIIAFNDEGLSNSETGSQMFVSINTDDQGVFDTDLENEFALMACALESCTDAEGRKLYSPAQVYRWLDNVRKMGLQQSFKLIENSTGGEYEYE